MVDPSNLAYISSIFGNGTRVSTPFALECALSTLGKS